MPKSSNLTAINVVEEISRRHSLPSGQVGVVRMAELLVQLKSIVWRTTTHSEHSASQIWHRLEAKGIDTEWILQMVNEFAFRIGWEYVKSEISLNIGYSLAWAKEGGALPSELRTLTATEDKYTAVFSKNCWLTFLYLLSISSATLLLPEIKHPAVQRAKE